jgi:hypothetical protein
VISGRSGIAFSHLKEAEDIQKQLVAKSRNLFKNSAVAFIETILSEDILNREVTSNDDEIKLFFLTKLFTPIFSAEYGISAQKIIFSLSNNSLLTAAFNF